MRFASLAPALGGSVCARAVGDARRASPTEAVSKRTCPPVRIFRPEASTGTASARPAICDGAWAMHRLLLTAACVAALTAPPAAADAYAEHARLAGLGQRGARGGTRRGGGPTTPRPRATPPPRACSRRPVRRRRSSLRTHAGGRRPRPATPRASGPRPRTRSGRRWHALAALRTLAQGPAFAGHPERALFAAELAEALLVGRLERRLRHADLFATLGRGDPAGVAEALAEALAAAQEAARAAASLRGRLGRDPAAEAAARESGLWRAVFEGVAERRAPRAAAEAALGLAVLPAGSAFFEEAPATLLAGRLEDPRRGADPPA